jgi:endonuclease YncB( thermonuclease family)
VVDGDTLEIEAPFLPSELKLFVRINGVDTPEKGSRSACKKESDLAKKATELMKDLIKKAKNISFDNIEWDKYGGRVLADVMIDKEKASDLLILYGVARPYHGEKKTSWCE